MPIATVFALAAAGCYSELDFNHIECDVNATDGCPVGYVCGSGGLCVRTTDAVDASIVDGALPGFIDAGGGEQRDGSMDGGASAVDQQTNVDLSGAERPAERDAPSVDGGLADALSADQASVDVAIGGDAPSAEAHPTFDTAGETDVAARSWNPSKIEAVSGVVHHAVAMDPVSGNAVVAWVGGGVSAAHYAAATNRWSSGTLVSSQADVTFVRAAADANGHFILVWGKRAGGTDDASAGVWASYSTGGVSWSVPTQLWASGGKDWFGDIQIAMNRAGQTVVVWACTALPITTLSDPDRLYSVYIEGTANQVPTVVATLAQRGEKALPRVGIDGSGNGLIAWAAPDGVTGTHSIWAAVFSMASVGVPSLLENNDDEADLPTVAMNSSGQGIVSWREDAATASIFYARRYSATGGWAATTDQVDRSSLAYKVSASLDRFGTANLVMSRGNAVGYQATFAWQPVGGSWSTEALEKDNQAVAPGYSGALVDLEPQIALDSQGNALAAWLKKVSDNEFVPHLRWRTAGVWGEDLEIGRVLDMFATDLQIAVSDDGRAIAAWNYYHCDSSVSNYASIICPTAKPMSNVSSESIAALSRVHLAVYR